MSPATVTTVLGAVDADRLGAVDAHEHLLLDWGFGPTADHDLRLVDRDEATAEAVAFRNAGGGTILDAMPTGLGRDVEGLMEVSRRSGVHVIATCGYHKAAYYPPEHWARRYGPDRQLELLLEEVTQGIDRHDHSRPQAERTAARPGVVKWATSHGQVDPFERRTLEVVGAVHRETGLPVLTHTEHATLAHEQLDLLEHVGVAPASVALSHLDRVPDLERSRELASRGAYLVHDGVGRERYRPVSAVVEVVRGLVDAGLGSSVLLGGDVARRSLRQAAGGPGVAGLFSSHVCALRAAGLDADTVRMLLEDNPARWLSGTRDADGSAAQPGALPADDEAITS